MKNKFITLTVAVVLCLALFTACAQSSGTPAKSGDGITLTDMVGRTVTLDKPAEKIVALEASDCEILCAIGAEDRLVGRGEYCDFPESIAEVPAVSSGTETNIEQLIALKPDVLIMTDMEQTEEQAAQLESAGIKVIMTDAQDINGVYEAINLIGKATGLTENAQALSDEMKATFDSLKKKPDEEPETVYFEVSPLEWGLWAAGRNTFMNEVAEMLGLRNCFDDVDGWAEISEEQVIERDPDHIVTISMYFGEGPTPEEEIMSRAGWENISAVKNGSILNIQSNELSRPGPRLADGAKMLSEFVYGR